MLCFGPVEQNFVYNAMGGLFGLAGSAALIIVWFFAKKHYALLAVGLAYAVDQGSKIFLEGLFTSLYNSGAIDLPITLLQLSSWFAFMLFFAHKSYVARPVGAV